MSQGRASIDTSSEIDQGPRPGKLLRELIRSGRSFSGRERHCCFLNTSGQRFTNISATSGLDFPDDGRAVSVVDWDLDGDLDFWIVNRSSPQVRFFRNVASHGRHFLAVRLEGNTCNRDAIGARVEVLLKKPKSDVENLSSDKGSQKKSVEFTSTDGYLPIASHHTPLIRSVRAGAGYLAQSSKWVHFGLGDSTEIDSLVVRWPGGDRERFQGLSADRHYRIVQGRGQPQTWDVVRGDVELKHSDFQAPQVSDRARVTLATPLPIPTVEFKTFEGGRRTIPASNSSARPTLVNLWASWCQPCLVELAEFSSRGKELHAADLEIIALNVDRLDENRSDEVAVQRIVKQLEFPFVAGWASAALLDQFQLLHDNTIDLHSTLPVPSSFLLDAEGQLAVIYKGPIEIDQLLIDIG